MKETVQEYIAGAETVTDDPLTRDYVVVRARLMAAKQVLTVGQFYFIFFPPRTDLIVILSEPRETRKAS